MPRDTQCYRYHGYGHVATQCLSRNLLVEGTNLDNDEFEEIYEPVGSASDIDKDIRVFSIPLSVIRCLHADLACSTHTSHIRIRFTS